jgi:hypothetical protein
LERKSSQAPLNYGRWPFPATSTQNLIADFGISVAITFSQNFVRMPRVGLGSIALEIQERFPRSLMDLRSQMHQ